MSKNTYFKLLIIFLAIVFTVVSIPGTGINLTEKAYAISPVKVEIPNLAGNIVPSFASDSWTTWSPRQNIAPEFKKIVNNGQRVLKMSSKGKFENYGKWLCTVPYIEGNSTYKFSVEYLGDKVENDNVSIVAMLTWKPGKGTALQRDYIETETPVKGGWKELSRTLTAPKSATNVSVELWLKNTDGGSVMWRKPTLVKVENEKPRYAKVITTYVKAKRGSLDSNLKAMLSVIDKAGKEKPDIICLSELVRERGVSKPLLEIGEPVPGNLTKIIGDKAKQYNTYIAFGMCEKDGNKAYNTAVIVGRNGEVVGKYRKVHLPLDEIEMGYTPGSEYPVFDLDFGRVGMMICWDQWFPEPARILRSKGAEMILVPTIGYVPPLATARAIENGTYLVVSGQEIPQASMIISPYGAPITTVAKEDLDSDGGIAAYNINLNQKYANAQYWNEDTAGALGEPRYMYMKERREDTYGELLGK